jgi:hypothetical protein
VVFPELTRYSYVSDVAETAALELSYALGGGADFSIGKLQMKPSFAESMERLAGAEALARYPRLSERGGGEAEARGLRIRRLKSDETQVEYLAVFLKVMAGRIKGLAPDRAGLRLLAAAYNSGFNLDREELEARSRRASFPYGPARAGAQFRYADIALAYYDQELREAAVSSLRKADLPPGSALALERIAREAGPRFLPPGVGEAELAGEAVCAKVVSRLFWSAFGGEDDLASARGVSGDAWMMSRNVRLFGGAAYPWSASVAASARPGDIIGLHYRLSVYNDRPKPVDYSHVALVVASGEGLGILVAHAWKVPDALLAPGEAKPWPLRLELLSDLAADYRGLFEPKELIRPRATGAGPQTYLP